MPENPDAHDEANPACRRDRGCCCPRAQRVTSDLDTLLATPGFAGSLLNSEVTSVTGRLPLLDKVVGVTVAGPVIMNDVGVHGTPVTSGGPIRTDPSRITLRLNPDRLGSALVTDPAANVPPTLRLFDATGNTAHATYLTEHSDRLAFEALSLSAPDSAEPGPATYTDTDTDTDTDHADVPAPQADQIAQFDSILGDGGVTRMRSLPGYAEHGYARAPSRRVIAALEHAALLGMPMTMATAAPGCIQMRHDQLDGAREHRGQMVIASGSCRAMINFNLAAECWITWSQGVWGRTGSIEIYDRHAQCAMVATQTGSVSAAIFEAWDHLLTDLSS